MLGPPPIYVVRFSNPKVSTHSFQLRFRVLLLGFLTEKRFSTHPVLNRFGQGFLLVKLQLHLSEDSATCQFVLFSLPSYLLKSILIETHSSLDPLVSGCGDPIIQRIVGSFDIDSVAGGLVDTAGGHFSIVTPLS